MFVDQLILLNVELLRPSSQVNIWSDVTTGTPRAWASATMESDSRRARVVHVHVRGNHGVEAVRDPTALSSTVSMSAGKSQVVSSGNCVVAW